MATLTRMLAEQSQKPGFPSGPPTQVAGSQVLGPLLAAFSGTIARNQDQRENSCDRSRHPSMDVGVTSGDLTYYITILAPLYA